MKVLIEVFRDGVGFLLLIAGANPGRESGQNGIKDMRSVSKEWFAGARSGTRLADAFIFSLPFLTFPVLAAADEPAVALSGTYEYVLYQGAAEPRSSARYNFEASVADCSWIMIKETIAKALVSNLAK